MKTDHKLTQTQNQGIIWPLILDGTGACPVVILYGGRPLHGHDHCM